MYSTCTNLAVQHTACLGTRTVLLHQGELRVLSLPSCHQVISLFINSLLIRIGDDRVNRLYKAESLPGTIEHQVYDLHRSTTVHRPLSQHNLSSTAERPRTS